MGIRAYVSREVEEFRTCTEVLGEGLAFGLAGLIGKIRGHFPDPGVTRVPFLVLRGLYRNPNPKTWKEGPTPGPSF